MLSKLLGQRTERPPTHREGDLYKEVTVGGKTFCLLYGYYEPFERECGHNEPIPLYPDFIRNPLYTEEGVPFVTAMQDICSHYIGKENGDSCAECGFYLRDKELFGFCGCGENRQPQE